MIIDPRWPPPAVINITFFEPFPYSFPRCWKWEVWLLMHSESISFPVAILRSHHQLWSKLNVKEDPLFSIWNILEKMPTWPNQASCTLRRAYLPWVTFFAWHNLIVRRNRGHVGTWLSTRILRPSVPSLTSLSYLTGKCYTGTTKSVLALVLDKLKEVKED